MGPRDRRCAPRRLDALIEEVTVDAYGESEQATAFLTALEEYLSLPFGATVLGEAVVFRRASAKDADRSQRAQRALFQAQGLPHFIRISWPAHDSVRTSRRRSITVVA